MRLIIAGSRELESYRVVAKAIDEFIKEHGPVTEIISGTARGVDRLGEKYAKDHHIALRQFPANWDYFGSVPGMFEMKRWLSTPMLVLQFGTEKAKALIT